ncbi:OapA family protein [methanotrophic endosymbiont of Bathymodiolus puteoserpentis (Logatchev)]|uniref:OapA family protein n=1 Tax=methanotrophic endosymbiont of Bathymodiolus puteoserpentis (Logatchev) TaxID=343235 RepID=UPI0013C9B01A|nr:peptidoglycan DD-metalloendopeptidase family protein [methanotrophic endosymbiont of Bathymodiolus puteoserpentis (Logatchev)]SHE19666.1 Peptidase, M23/M37 family [methanotrophic endosymbiont of Bathymodiolus puteoserpentis (Logatchev)]
MNHLILGLVCAILATASYAFFSVKSTSSTLDEIALTIPDITTNIEQPIKLPDTNNTLLETSTTPSKASHKPSMQSLSTVWQEHKIKPGESLSAIFSKNKLSKSDLHKIVHANNIGSQFATIRAGKSLMIGLNIAGELSHLTYKKSPYEELKATRLEDGNFNVELSLKKIERRISSASVTIHSSLFVDGISAGLSNQTIMQLADIFAWDIDFALDIRENDQFFVLYESLYINDKPIGTGNILAAKFINQGHPTTAIRFKDPTGKTSYYTPKGNSMRKAFIRTPIPFARISSRFNLKRKHPVLNRIRAHKGVDYAARTGTPIKATGDGKITFRGKQRGYGNVVIIQHGQQYSTLYAHMSKFRKGQRRGSHINQGDIIGYVGQTGLASGPHLHYEFRINGKHRNPLTVSFPNSNPIQKKYKTAFLAQAKPLLNQLESLNKTQLAQKIQ